MTDLVALRAENAKRWAAARLTRDFKSVAERLVATNAKQRYFTVSRKTGVPWWFIAVVHEREASQNWNTQLGQGDSLHSVSVHIPKGRGPFSTWEDGAFDALANCAPFAARNTDWSAGGALTMLEEYNGIGYANRGIPSPYIWSGTDQYKSGKYVRDGVFDPNVVDSQLGCAGLLKAMMALDASITFSGLVIQSAKKPTMAVPKPVQTAPSITSPAPGSIGTFIASIFTRLFGKKAP